MSSTEQDGEALEPTDSTQDRAPFDDQVLVGGQDFVFRQIAKRLADLEEGSDDFRKACDLVRVGIGTLLKTDQVSFLLGAGCSLDAGGVSLRTIPYQIESCLLQQGLDEDGSVAPWLTLFYSVAEKLGDGLSRDPDERSGRLFSIDMAVDHEGTDSENARQLIREFCIPVNLEALLSQLHTWSAGLLADKIAVTCDKGGKLVIPRDALRTVIQHLTAGLARTCALPSSAAEDPMKHHRLLIQRLLTRPVNLRRVALFTLNYDTLLEQAMDSCGVVAVDGFVGSVRRVFRPESYDHDLYFPGDTTEGRVHRLDRVMHLYKLHGSVTWRAEEPDWDDPYGLYADHQGGGSNGAVVIYPTPLKAREALGMPYSEMFRRFASNVVRPQSVLFVLGYSFSDDHVTAIIRQALTIPSFTLVVVDPDPKSEFAKQLEQTADKRVWIIKGSRMGRFSGFVERLLPDLDEERILLEVLKTYKALDPKQLADNPPSSGGDDGQ